MTAETTARPEMTAETSTLEANARALDEAMAKVPTLDPLPKQVVTDAIEALNALHKDGLTTVVRHLRDDPRGRELLYELVDEPGVRMLLAMHGIIRPDPVTLAQQVLAQVRPGLQSHGGDVELSHLDDGVAYVRLQGACNGCSMASVTMRDGVEQALVAGVPGLRSVEVLPNDPSPTLIPLDSIRVRAHDPADGSGTGAEELELRSSGWARAAGLGDCGAGELVAVTVAPEQGGAVEAIVVNVGGQLSAYVNACAHQGLPLTDALVDESTGTLTCPWHGFCYDVAEGECLTLTGASLQSMPLRVVGDAVWVRPGG